MSRFVTFCRHGATGGMCDLTPEILSVQVFASDGITPAPGKGALNPGGGYSLSYSGAPNCQLRHLDAHSLGNDRSE